MLGDVFVCFCLKLLAMFLLHMRISIFQYQFDFSKFFRHSKFACRVQKQQRTKTPARAGERNAKPRLASRGHVTSTCFAHAKKTRIEILKFCSPLKVRSKARFQLGCTLGPATPLGMDGCFGSLEVAKNGGTHAVNNVENNRQRECIPRRALTLGRT